MTTITDLTAYRGKRRREQYARDLLESQRAIAHIDPPWGLPKAVRALGQRSMANALRR